MPPPSCISKGSGRSNCGHEKETEIGRNEQNNPFEKNFRDREIKSNIRSEAVGVVKSLLGPSLEDAVLRTLEFGKSLIQKPEIPDFVAREKKGIRGSKKDETKFRFAAGLTEQRLHVVLEERTFDRKGNKIFGECKKRNSFAAKLDRKTKSSSKRLSTVSKIRSLDSDLKKDSLSPEKIKRQLQALIQINKDEPPENIDNIFSKSSKLPMELTVMPALYNYGNETDLNISPPSQSRGRGSEVGANGGITFASCADSGATTSKGRQNVRRRPNKLPHAPEFLSNALGPTIDVAIIDNLKMMRDILNPDCSRGEGIREGLREGIREPAIMQRMEHEVRLQNSEGEMSARLEELQKRIEELETKEQFLVRQIEEEERERDNRRRAFKEEERRLLSVPIPVKTEYPPKNAFEKRALSISAKSQGDTSLQPYESSLSQSESKTRQGENSSRQGDSNSRQGENSSRQGDSNSRQGENSSRQGDSNSRHGDSTSRHGDSTSRHGEIISRHGDSTSRHGEIISRHGDSTSRHGEIISRHGDSTSRHGEIISRHGDSTSRHGDIISRHGDSTSRHGDIIPRHGDITSRHGDSNSRQLESNSRQLESISRQGESISRQVESISRQMESISRQGEGNPRLWEGTMRQCEGIIRQCEGTMRECEGNVRQCEGAVRKCESSVRHWETMYENLRAKVASEEEKLSTLRAQCDSYKKELSGAGKLTPRDTLKHKNKCLLDAWDVFASRACHTRLPSFSRTMDLERKQLGIKQYDTTKIHCCFPSLMAATIPDSLRTSRRGRSQSTGEFGGFKGSQSDFSRSGSKEHVCESSSKIRLKIKSGDVQFPIQRDIQCGLHQLLKTCCCSTKPPQRAAGSFITSEEDLARRFGGGKVPSFTNAVLDLPTQRLVKKASASKMASRSKSDTAVRRDKNSRIVKVLWAITRINIFQNNCRTYEIMDASPCPPACTPVKTEGIFVVKCPPRRSSRSPSRRKYKMGC